MQVGYIFLYVSRCLSERAFVFTLTFCTVFFFLLLLLLLFFLHFKKKKTLNRKTELCIFLCTPLGLLINSLCRHVLRSRDFLLLQDTFDCDCVLHLTNTVPLASGNVLANYCFYYLFHLICIQIGRASCRERV